MYGKYGIGKYFVILILFLMVKGAVPGTFFRRPRLGTDFSVPTTQSSIKVNLPTKGNIREGLVTLVDGCQMGVTVIALASGVSSAAEYRHLNPLSAYFYTNAYRWALRHFSLIPLWIGGSGGHYCQTHKVWRRRFLYMDEFVPQWMRTFLPYVNKEEWKKEEDELKRFKKVAESAFGRHYRYPSKKFNNFKSQETKESREISEDSSSSLQF